MWKENRPIHCLSFRLYYIGVQVNKDQSMYDLSTRNVFNLHIFCDACQKISYVKPVNTHSNRSFSQLSKNPVDNLVYDPVIIMG